MAIAAQGSAPTDDSVAGNRDGDRIGAAGLGHRSRRPGLADVRSQICIGSGGSVRDGRNRIPDPALELGAPHVEGQLELAGLASQMAYQGVDEGRHALGLVLQLHPGKLGAQGRLDLARVVAEADVTDATRRRRDPEDAERTRGDVKSDAPRVHLRFSLRVHEWLLPML